MFRDLSGRGKSFVVNIRYYSRSFWSLYFCIRRRKTNFRSNRRIKKRLGANETRWSPSDPVETATGISTDARSSQGICEGSYKEKKGRKKRISQFLTRHVDSSSRLYEFFLGNAGSFAFVEALGPSAEAGLQAKETFSRMHFLYNLILWACHIRACACARACVRRRISLLSIISATALH